MLPTKSEMIERLRKHPLYKAALASVDGEQRARIAAMSEGFVASAFDGIIPAFSSLNKDAPETSNNENNIDTNQPDQNH